MYYLHHSAVSYPMSYHYHGTIGQPSWSRRDHALSPFVPSLPLPPSLPPCRATVIQLEASARIALVIEHVTIITSPVEHSLQCSTTRSLGRFAVDTYHRSRVALSSTWQSSHDCEHLEQVPKSSAALSHALQVCLPATGDISAADDVTLLSTCGTWMVRYNR